MVEKREKELTEFEELEKQKKQRAIYFVRSKILKEINALLPLGNLENICCNLCAVGFISKL